MTVPPAALRTQEADRWARRSAVACGTAILVGFLLPLRWESAFLLQHLIQPDAGPSGWLWPWEWLPLVPTWFLGIALSAPLAGALAIAVAARRRGRDRARRDPLLLCAALALLGWAGPFVAAAGRAWNDLGRTMWALVLPSVAAAVAWGATHVRARRPGFLLPAVVSGIGGAALVAWLLVPAWGHAQLPSALVRMPFRFAVVLVLGSAFLGLSAVLACLPSGLARRACDVARIAGWCVAVLVPWAAALADDEAPRLAAAWPLVGARWALLWGGGLALGRAGVVAYLDARVSRRAERAEAAELEQVFG